jgi:hypothetical protein
VAVRWRPTALLPTGAGVRGIGACHLRETRGDSERGEIEVVVDQVAERELEGAGQHLLCEIDRDELQAVVGRLESRHRRAPEKRCGIITTACKRMRVGGVFLQPQRLNSPALRGFMRKVRWNDGLGIFRVQLHIHIPFPQSWKTAELGEPAFLKLG